MLETIQAIIDSQDATKLSEYFSQNILIKHPHKENLLDYNTGKRLFEKETFDLIKAYTYLSYIIIEASFASEKVLMKVKHNALKIQNIYIASVQDHMMRVRCDISYDGSNYLGFQRQPHKKTIQNEVESVLKHIYKSAITIHPASRTDAGVHAKHQVFHFDCPKTLVPLKIKSLLNKMLPESIHVFAVKEVPCVFHSRYDTLSKTYQYKFHHYKDPFKSQYSVYHESFDLVALNMRLTHFIGNHDFANFAKSENKNTTRTIYNAVGVSDEKTTIIELRGNGFLRHMVRMIVGHVLNSLKSNIDTIPSALKNPHQQIPKYLAPAEGLYLAKIDY